MRATSSSVVFVGEIAIAGVLLANALVGLAAALVGASSIERALNVAFALWLGVVALLLPIGSPRWHIAALVTTVVVSLFSVLAILGGALSFATGFGALYFAGAAIYLALTAKRKRLLHGI